MRRDLTLKPLGYVQSPFKQKFGTPRQSGLVPAAEAQVILDKDFVPPGSLDGLSQFSHIWLLFHFHKNNNEVIHGKIKPPRLNGGKVGLFATRTPHRPNPVGLSLVELVSVDEEKRILYVRGLDLIDQTPVFDIKPHIATYDNVTQGRAGWTEQAEDKIFEVQWSEQALKQAEELKLTLQNKAFLQQALSRDLRNAIDKEINHTGKNFKALFAQWDLEFSYSESTVEIKALKPGKDSSKI